MVGLLVAAVTFVLKLLGWTQGPKASAEAVAAGNAAQERTVAQVDAATAQAETRIAQAEASAPHDQQAVVDALDKGEF